MKNWLLGAGVLAVGAAAMLHPPSGKQAALVADQLPAPHAQHRSRPSPAAYDLVYVAGAVRAAGLYRVPAGSRAFAAVRLAGGLRGDADPAGVNLAEVVADGQEIAVPVLGERIRRAPARTATARKRSRTAKSAPPGQLDLNTADAGSLMQLPGVGKALAERLVQFRDANGPFVSLDELADVAGMTPRRIDALTPFLYIKR